VDALMASKADTELLREAKERHKEAEDLWAENRKRWLEDQRFRNRDQWPEKIKKERDDAGRPCFVVDNTEQYVRQVVNDGRQNRPGPKVSPIDDKGDIKVADAYKGFIRSICSKSSADQAFDTALDHAAGNGYGFFRLVTQYEHEKSFNQEIAIRRVRNPMAVLLGPHMEADGSDAPYGFVVDDIRKAVFKQKYPKAKMAEWGDGGFADGWSSEHTVRVVEYFYREEEPGKLFLLDDGTSATEDEYLRDLRPEKPENPEEMNPDVEYKPAIVDMRVVPITKVRWCRLSGCEILEKNEWPGKYIPIIPVYGVERDINGKVVYEGLIRPAADPQRLYNFSRCAFAEHVSLSTKQPPVAAAGQLEGFEDEWERANTENIAVLHYNPMDVEGHQVPPPYRMPPTSMPTALAADMETSLNNIQSSMGMYDASIGQKSNEKSGVAIQARDRQSDVGTFHYHDNLNRAVRYLYRQLVDLIPKVIDNRRAGRLLGDDGKATSVMFDPNVKTWEKRGEMMVYNLGAGTYDVDVDTGPNYTTKRQETAASQLEMARANPRMWETHGDIIAETQDWTGADRFARRSKLLLPPEIQEAEADEGEQTPEVRAVTARAKRALAQADEQLAQAEQAIQERDAALEDAERKVKDLESQLKNKDAESAAKMIDAGTGRYEAQTERMATMAPPITPEIVQQIADAAAEAVMNRVVASPSGPPEKPPLPPDLMAPIEEPPPGGFFTPEGM
jgi:hypothetical protein